MSGTDFAYELDAGHPDPQVGDVLRVPHYIVGREPVLVTVGRVDACLTLQPPAWWVHGQDRAGYGVRVYVHRQHPQRAARIGAPPTCPGEQSPPRASAPLVR